MSDVNFVKLFARSIERLQSGEISRLRLVGFSDATLERRALAYGLIEDQKHSLGPDTETRVLLNGNFEIARIDTIGHVIEIDISKAIPD